MKTPIRTEFLDRSSYRQRRFRDAARWLPIFAAVLMMLPLMWPRKTRGQRLSCRGVIYVFGIWVLLVALAFLLSRVLRFSEALEGDGERSGWGEK